MGFAELEAVSVATFSCNFRSLVEEVGSMETQDFAFLREAKVAGFPATLVRISLLLNTPSDVMGAALVLEVPHVSGQHGARTLAWCLQVVAMVVEPLLEGEACVADVHMLFVVRCDSGFVDNGAGEAVAAEGAGCCVSAVARLRCVSFCFERLEHFLVVR